MNDEIILKNIKILFGDADNKICFDCSVKNPTYINVSIGSFVCMNCAGKLRNFNFRVKAIGLSTFSQSEYELILRRGNEACRYIFMNSNSTPNPVDVLKSMNDKYKLKLWFRELPPHIEQEIIEKNKLLINSSLETTIVKPKTLANINSSVGLIIASNSRDNLNNNSKYAKNFSKSDQAQASQKIKEKCGSAISASLSCLPEFSPKNPFKNENKSSLNLFDGTVSSNDRYAALIELDSIFNCDQNQKIGSSGYVSNQSSFQNEFSFGNPFLSNANNDSKLHENSVLLDFDPFEDVKKSKRAVETSQNLLNFNPFETSVKKETKNTKLDEFDPFSSLNF